MKKLFTTCMLLAAAATASFAQAQKVATKTTTTTKTTSTQTRNANSPTPEQIAERRANNYKAQYNLNQDQYKAVYQAELDNVLQDQNARAGGNQPSAGQTMQMNMTRDKKLKAAMTAEQYSKYEASQSKTN